MFFLGGDRSFRHIVLFAVHVAMVAAVVPAGADSNPPEDTRARVADWLQQQEQLVHSAEAEFEEVPAPTDPKKIELIKEVCRRRGDEAEYISYVCTDNVVRTQAYRARWWRKGIKERWEIVRFLAKDGDEVWETTRVFDGSTVRALSVAGAKQVGELETPERAHWNSANRTHPFSLLFEFYGRPYSHLIRNSPDCRVSELVQDGERWTKVAFADPEDPTMRVELLFDGQRRLMERKIFFKLSRDPAPRLYETHRFEDYRSCTDDAGRVIVFPFRALYTYYLEPLPDGTLVDYVTRTITVKDIRFNVDIPDDMFVLEIPKHIPYYDGIYGKRWVNVPRGDQYIPAGRWALFLSINAALLVAVALYGYIRWRASRRKAPSAGVNAPTPQPPEAT